MRLERIALKILGLIFLLMLSLELPVTGGDAPAADYQGTIKIGGTGGAYGVMTQVAAAFQKQYPQVRFYFSPSLGSAGGIKALLAGALDLGMSARPLTAREIQGGAVATPFGRSPLMLVTSHLGAELNFTLREIANLYLGDLDYYPDGTPIRLILRPRGDSDTAFLLSLSPEIAAAFRKAHAREGMIVATTDEKNADILEKIRGAMGWMTLGQLISEGRQLKPLTLENVRPGLDTLASGAYPYYKLYSVVTGANPTPLVKSFIAFLISAEGLEILSKNGYLVEGKRP